MSRLGKRVGIREFLINGADRIMSNKRFEIKVDLLDIRSVENGLIEELAGESIDVRFGEWFEDFLKCGSFAAVYEKLQWAAQRERAPEYIGIVTGLEFDNPLQRKMEIRRSFIWLTKSLSKYYPLLFARKADFSLQDLDELEFLFKDMENTRFMLRCRDSGIRLWFKDWE